MKQRSGKDVFVIGFALFSMFFGAGNVVFPPFLGVGAGPEWVLGLVCYYIADIGLALFAMFAMFRGDGVDSIMRPIGKIPSALMMCAIVLCIGPMLAIPRTSAMTFELAVQPMTESIGSVLFSILFFLLVFVCTVRENAVVDIVGKIMTPLLLIGLVILIVKGIITPIGTISQAAQADNVAANGIKAGYQTMDVLATMLFGGVILHSVDTKGYRQPKEKSSIAIKASLVSGAILLLVYSGLTYLGASVSDRYDLSISRSDLLLAITSDLLGKHGTILFAAVVALACITTAVGLVSACAKFFADLSGGRVSYALLVGILCVFSAVVSNVGLDQLVAIAAPILDIVYPPTLVLITAAFIPKLPDTACRFAVAGALVMSLLTTAVTYTSLEMPALAVLPLDSIGLGWIVPALLCGAIGWAWYGIRAAKKA